MRHDHTRGGFLLLMVIAFASIILGLATTFFIYCKRGLDEGNLAVKVAEQRLALHSALALTYATIAYTPSIPMTAPITARFPTTPVVKALNLGSDPRTQRMGWFRTVLANDIYQGPGFSSTQLFSDYKAPPSPEVNARPNFKVMVTVGVGPSQGAQTPTDPTDWQYEQRAWSLLTIQDAGSEDPLNPPKICWIKPLGLPAPPSLSMW